MANLWLLRCQLMGFQRPREGINFHGTHLQWSMEHSWGTTWTVHQSFTMKWTMHTHTCRPNRNLWPVARYLLDVGVRRNTQKEPIHAEKWGGNSMQNMVYVDHFPWLRNGRWLPYFFHFVCAIGLSNNLLNLESGLTVIQAAFEL